MKVRLLYFAVLRDITGSGEEQIDIPEGTRASDLWSSLRQKHRRLAAYERQPMTAINQSYAAADQLLHDGDEVAFIPPVAGG